MTEEQVKRGAKLLQEIAHCKDLLRRLEKANGFYGSTVKMSDGNTLTELRIEDFMDFGELREMAISRFTERLEAKQKEFDNL